MTDWIAEYREARDANERYAILRRELTALRRRFVGEYFDGDGERPPADEIPEYYDPDAVGATIDDLSDRVDGQFVVFVANDFGLPVAYRPAGTEHSLQNQIREAILAEKYSAEATDLQAIRDTLLDTHPGIHKAIVAEVGADGVRYHLPEGSNRTTNFLTVREMVGLIDYTTNSSQRDDLSRTY